MAPLSIIGWVPGSHVETALYIFAVLLILYFPPRLFRDSAWFVREHYGDAFGLFILLLGVGLTVASDVWSNLTHVFIIANGLVMTAMAILKLKTNPPGTNGNGHTETLQVTTTSTDPSTPPATPDQAASSSSATTKVQTSAPAGWPGLDKPPGGA
jgi:hypothetical protein